MRREDRRKRPAIEPAEALLGPEHPGSGNAAGRGSATPSKRPPTTSLGSVFAVVRGLAGLLWVAAFVVEWPEILKMIGSDPDIDDYVFWFIISIGVASSLVLFVLAWSIWRGSNVARVLVMLGLTVSVIAAAIGYFVNGEQITIRTTLVTLALDILVLLALSSRPSRAWSRRSILAHQQRNLHE